MSQVTFDQIKFALRSLSAKTDLFMEIGSIRVTLWRRNSPYKSHRRVEFAEIKPRSEPYVIAAYNEAVELEIWGHEPPPRPDEPDPSGRYAAKWRSMQIPRAFLEDLRRITESHFGRLPFPWTDAGLMWVSVLAPVVDRFEGSKPVFRPRPWEPCGNTDQPMHDQPLDSGLSRDWSPEDLSALLAESLPLEDGVPPPLVPPIPEWRVASDKFLDEINKEDK